MNIAAKINASIAKSLAVIGVIVVVLAYTLRFYSERIYLPKLSLYKSATDCTVRVYSVKDKSVTRFYAQIVYNNGRSQEKLTLNSDYYNYLKKYDGKENVKLSFFVTSTNRMFVCDYNWSEKKAAERYKTYYPPKLLKMLSYYIVRVGYGLIAMGLLAWGISKRYSNPDETYIRTEEDIEESKVLVDQFDNELDKSPYSYRKHIVEQPMPEITENEREEFIEQLDELTENQRYKYSNPYEYHIKTPEEIENDKAFANQFDEEVSKDPYKYSRLNPDDKSHSEEEDSECITMDEREELLKQYDELTSDGKYKYKTHD